MSTGWTAAAADPVVTARLEPSYPLFVDGGFVDGSGEPATTVNPATGQALAEVATASWSDVDRAVQAARRCYDKAWSRLAGAERARQLVRIARLVQQRAPELAMLESLDTGTPLRQARDDVAAAAAQLFHHAGWADKLGFAGYGPDPRPLGVAGAVIPWQHPVRSAAAKIAPALACGNTVVLKPGETAPLAAAVFGEICRQAHLPAGAVNILPGDAAAGAALVEHPGVDTVAFSGSAEVGKQIQHALAGTGRRLTLDLGGKGAAIVFDDAPVEQAVEAIVGATFTEQGRGRWERLLVQEPVAGEVLDRLRARAATLRVGDPLDPATDIGPVVSAGQLDRITALVAAGDAAGARRWTSRCPLPQRGWFVAPTVFSGVAPGMRIAREEVAGPVLSALTFRTAEEAVDTANDTPYGVSAGVWTGTGSRALWAARRVRAGVVWANTATRFDPAAPFGGYRESGLGREGGREGLAAYLEDGGLR